MILVKLVEFELLNDVNNESDKFIYGAFESWIEIRKFLNENWYYDGNRYTINELTHCMVESLDELYEKHGLWYVDELAKKKINELIENNGTCYSELTYNMYNW